MNVLDQRNELGKSEVFSNQTQASEVDHTMIGVGPEKEIWFRWGGVPGRYLPLVPYLC